MKYGVRIVISTWATVDGGPDCVGSKEEMETLAARLRADARPEHEIIFVAAPYTGNDPEDSDADQASTKT